MGRDGQFTYTSTMLITTPELKSLLSQAKTANKDTATAEISLLFNLTSLIHLMCLKELLPTWYAKKLLGTSVVFPSIPNH